MGPHLRPALWQLQYLLAHLFLVQLQPFALRLRGWMSGLGDERAVSSSSMALLLGSLTGSSIELDDDALDTNNRGEPSGYKGR